MRAGARWRGVGEAPARLEGDRTAEHVVARHIANGAVANGGNRLGGDRGVALQAQCGAVVNGGAGGGS